MYSITLISVFGRLFSVERDGVRTTITLLQE